MVTPRLQQRGIKDLPWSGEWRKRNPVTMLVANEPVSMGARGNVADAVVCVVSGGSPEKVSRWMGLINAQRGALLIEVLVTMVIVVVGLLGLAGMQVQLQKNELESYQRGQALLLVDDMANRIALNRTGAADYVTGAANPLGAGMNCPTAVDNLANRDKGQWCKALQGAGEVLNGSSVGALIGGRGCVEAVGGGTYMVTVVWQGLTPIAAPPSSVGCGVNLYDGDATSGCKNDRCRRYVTTLVTIANLTP